MESIALKTPESCGVHLRQEFGVGTDRLQLVFPQATQFFLTEPPFLQEFPEHVRELRVAVVVLAIDLFTAFGQVMFQVPQIRRLLDLAGHLLCFLDHLVKLPLQSSVEGFAGDGLF